MSMSATTIETMTRSNAIIISSVRARRTYVQGDRSKEFQLKRAIKVLWVLTLFVSSAIIYVVDTYPFSSTDHMVLESLSDTVVMEGEAAFG